MFLKACIEVFLLCVSCVSYAQTGVRERVVFYNTENLFDTRNDTLTADDDFTPRGKQHWNRERYTRKLLNISKVLNSLGAGKFSPGSYKHLRAHERPEPLVLRLLL